MATLRQIEVIKENLAVLGEEINMEYVNSLSYEGISKYMTELFDRANEVKRTRPSLSQIKMVEDMMQCPLLKKEIVELKGIPQRWITMKEELCDYIVKAEKFLARPTKSIKVMDITGNTYECMLDYLLEANHIDMEQYKKALWFEGKEILEYIKSKARALNLEIREKAIYRTVKQPTMKVEMELAKAKVRVAKANEVIENYQFDLATADKQHIGMWIENNRETYREWLSDRPTDGQVELILELVRRLNTDVYSSRMINEDGVEIKGNRWLHHHGCANLTREQVLAMSKAGADDFIKQLEKEASNPILTDVKVVEAYHETRTEKLRSSDETQFMDDFFEVFGTMGDFSRGEISKEEVYNTMLNFLSTHSGHDVVKSRFQ